MLGGKNACLVDRTCSPEEAHELRAILGVQRRPEAQCRLDEPYPETLDATHRRGPTYAEPLGNPRIRDLRDEPSQQQVLLVSDAFMECAGEPQEHWR